MGEPLGEIVGRSEATQVLYSEVREEEGHMDERIVGKLMSDVENIQTNIADMKVDIRELRGDMKAANESVSVLKADLSALRTELGAQKSQTHAGFASVRSDMKAEFTTIRAEMGGLNKTVKLWLALNITAMLLTGASILGVMARLLKLI